MGVPADIDAKLTTTFTVAQPTFSLDSVLDLARRVNPDLAAKKSRETASADPGAASRRRSYLPSLSLSTGYGAQCVRLHEFRHSRAASALAQCGSVAAGAACDRLAPRRRRSAGRSRAASGTLTADQLAAIRATNKPFKLQEGAVQLSAFAVAPDLQRIPARSEPRAGQGRARQRASTTCAPAISSSRPTSRRRTSTS